MSVRITFLGGLGEIGRNCAALEIDGRICLIDVGLMFPEEDMLGVDLVFPDWSWLVERRADVDFVVLTHGHEDHMGALGYFLREAAKQPWFDDTLFVVVADHGARVYGKAEIPLETYEIPLLMYAPKHFAPRQVDTLMTQIDIAPTVLGVLGLPYEAPFFGIDALHDSAAAQARVALFSHNHDIAILRDNVLEVLGLGKTHEAFTYDPVLKTFKPRADDPALRALGIAYFQTATDMFKSGRYN